MLAPRASSESLLARGMAGSHRTRSSTGATRQRSSMGETQPGVPVHQLPQELLREIFALVPFHERCVKGSLPADSATPPIGGGPSCPGRCPACLCCYVSPFARRLRQIRQCPNPRTTLSCKGRNKPTLWGHSRCCERAWLPMHGIYASVPHVCLASSGMGVSPGNLSEHPHPEAGGLLRQPAVVSRNPQLKSFGSCKPSRSRTQVLARTDRAARVRLAADGGSSRGTLMQCRRSIVCPCGAKPLPSRSFQMTFHWHSAGPKRTC